MVGGNALCTHHITASSKGSYPAVSRYLVKMGFEPTLNLDPTTGQRGQYLPANRSAYALEHPAGQPETNREGSVNVQIEWVWPSMTDDITKAPHFAAIWADLIPWLEALGVPSLWTFGNPAATSRDAKVWRKAGHRGHKNAPANTHVDSLPCKTSPPWTVAPPMTDAHRTLIHDATTVLNGRRHGLNAEDCKAVAELNSAAVALLNRS